MITTRSLTCPGRRDSDSGSLPVQWHRHEDSEYASAARKASFTRRDTVALARSAAAGLYRDSESESHCQCLWHYLNLKLTVFLSPSSLPVAGD